MIIKIVVKKIYNFKNFQNQIIIYLDFNLNLTFFIFNKISAN